MWSPGSRHVEYDPWTLRNLSSGPIGVANAVIQTGENPLSSFLLPLQSSIAGSTVGTHEADLCSFDTATHLV